MKKLGIGTTSTALCGHGKEIIPRSRSHSRSVSLPRWNSVLIDRINGKNDKSTSQHPHPPSNLQKGLRLSLGLQQVLNVRKNYLVHDEGEICSQGDVVRIEAGRPLGARKHFALAEILQRRNLGSLADMIKEE